MVEPNAHGCDGLNLSSPNDTRTPIAGVFTVSSVLPLTRIRLTTWLLIAWTALGAVGAYWGYRSVMESCPPEDDFSGCFEPPYRLAASFVFVLWGTVEATLIGTFLLQRWGNRR
jgi:hypothetical protein